jgi:hypothetical protein
MVLVHHHLVLHLPVRFITTIMDVEDTLLHLHLGIGTLMEGMIEIVILEEGLTLLHHLHILHILLGIGYHLRRTMIGEILEDHHHPFHRHLRHIRIRHLHRCRNGKEIVKGRGRGIGKERGIDLIDIRILQTETMLEVSFFFGFVELE